MENYGINLNPASQHQVNQQQNQINPQQHQLNSHSNMGSANCYQSTTLEPNNLNFFQNNYQNNPNNATYQSTQTSQLNQGLQIYYSKPLLQPIPQSAQNSMIQNISQTPITPNLNQFNFHPSSAFTPPVLENNQINSIIDYPQQQYNFQG